MVVPKMLSDIIHTPELKRLFYDRKATTALAQVIDTAECLL